MQIFPIPMDKHYSNIIVRHNNIYQPIKFRISDYVNGKHLCECFQFDSSFFFIFVIFPHVICTFYNLEFNLILFMFFFLWFSRKKNAQLQRKYVTFFLCVNIKLIERRRRRKKKLIRSLFFLLSPMCVFISTPDS